MCNPLDAGHAADVIAEQVKEEASEIPKPQEIVMVRSGEELANLVLKSLQGLMPVSTGSAESAERIKNAEETLQFLAGTLSALQLQNMQLLAYLQYIQVWTERASLVLKKLDGKVGSPFSFEVWANLQSMDDPAERAAYLAQIRKDQPDSPRIITLS